MPSLLHNADGSRRLLDYSVHPPTRLGLHNAMLTRNDRVEILEAYGGEFECEVFVIEGMNSHPLTQELAVRLFHALPSGEVKWLTIREFLWPPGPPPELPESPAQSQQLAAAQISHETQLHLFEYTHPQDEQPQVHHFDADA